MQTPPPRLLLYNTASLLNTIILLLSSVLPIYVTLLNRRECDNNNNNIITSISHVSMDKGCHLQDHDKRWRTHKCENGYELWCDKCIDISNCGEGTFRKGYDCYNCPLNCDECHGNEQYECDACTDNYIHDFRKICIFNCQVDSTYGTVDEGCQPCHPECRSCFTKYDTTCTSCFNTGHFVIMDYTIGRTNSGYCIPKTQRGYDNYFRMYGEDHMIIQCPTGCQTCIDRYQCTSCMPGFSLHPPLSNTKATPTIKDNNNLDNDNDYRMILLSLQKKLIKERNAREERGIPRISSYFDNITFDNAATTTTKEDDDDDDDDSDSHPYVTMVSLIESDDAVEDMNSRERCNIADTYNELTIRVTGLNNELKRIDELVNSSRECCNNNIFKPPPPPVITEHHEHPLSSTTNQTTITDKVAATRDDIYNKIEYDLIKLEKRYLRIIKRR